MSLKYLSQRLVADLGLALMNGAVLQLMALLLSSGGCCEQTKPTKEVKPIFISTDSLMKQLSSLHQGLLSEQICVKTQ